MALNTECHRRRLAVCDRQTDMFIICSCSLQQLKQQQRQRWRRLTKQSPPRPSFKEEEEEVELMLNEKREGRPFIWPFFTEHRICVCIARVCDLLLLSVWVWSCSWIQQIKKKALLLAIRMDNPTLSVKGIRRKKERKKWCVADWNLCQMNSLSWCTSAAVAAAPAVVRCAVWRTNE